MKRRSFLAATAVGMTTGASGCLAGEVVMEVNESPTIPEGEGWIKEIDEVDGSGGIGYTVRSDDDRFEVFYFRGEETVERYRQATLGGAEPAEPPLGYEPLRSVATENEDSGVYEAAMPADGSRYSIDIEGSHYLVVDNSGYGTVEATNSGVDLSVVVNLEVVEDRF